MRQRFILVRGAVRAKPYSSGVAALVFVCSIIGVVAPSYEVDGIGGRWIDMDGLDGSLARGLYPLLYRKER